MRLAARVLGKSEFCDARKRHANGDRPAQHLAIHLVTHPRIVPVMMLVILSLCRPTRLRDQRLLHRFQPASHGLRYGCGTFAAPVSLFAPVVGSGGESEEGLRSSERRL